MQLASRHTDGALRTRGYKSRLGALIALVSIGIAFVPSGSRPALAADECETLVLPTTSKASSTFTTGTGYTPGPRNTYTYRAITSLSDEHSSGSLADTFLFKHPNTTGTITYGFPKLTNASGVALWTQEAMWDYGDGPIHTFYFEVTYNGGDSTAITPTYTTDKPTKGEMSGPGQYFAFGKNYSDVTELVLVAEDGWYDTDDAADNPGIGYISTTELAKIGSPLNDKYNMTLSSSEPAASRS